MTEADGESTVPSKTSVASVSSSVSAGGLDGHETKDQVTAPNQERDDEVQQSPMGGGEGKAPSGENESLSTESTSVVKEEDESIRDDKEHSGDSREKGEEDVVIQPGSGDDSVILPTKQKKIEISGVPDSVEESISSKETPGEQTEGLRSESNSEDGPILDTTSDNKNRNEPQVAENSDGSNLPDSDGKQEPGGALASQDNQVTGDTPEADDTLESEETESSSTQMTSEEPSSKASDTVSRDESGDEPEQVLVDYASKISGAQILEKTYSIKGASNLLTGDKDKYSIAPCEDKKYVVVGLSEDILVKQIKLSNYERYSSRVKEFQVLVSQEYPVPNEEYWESIGTYEAESKSGEQEFELETPSWARYIKFRFLSHYGSEHYCTLSQIKIHGSTMLQGFHEQWTGTEGKDTAEVEIEQSESSIDVEHSKEANEDEQDVEENSSVEASCDESCSEDVIGGEHLGAAEGDAVMVHTSNELHDSDKIHEPKSEGLSAVDADGDPKSTTTQESAVGEVKAEVKEVEVEVKTVVETADSRDEVSGDDVTELTHEPADAAIPADTEHNHVAQIPEDTAEDEIAEGALDDELSQVEPVVSAQDDADDLAEAQPQEVLKHPIQAASANITPVVSNDVVDYDESDNDEEESTASISTVTNAVKSAVADASGAILNVKEVIRTTIGTGSDQSDEQDLNGKSDSKISRTALQESSHDEDVNESDSEIRQNATDKDIKSEVELEHDDMPPEKSDPEVQIDSASLQPIVETTSEVESRTAEHNESENAKGKDMLKRKVLTHDAAKKEKDELGSTFKMVAELSHRFPHAACVKDLDFNVFKRKLMIAANGDNSKGMGKMEPVFAKIATEIKNVQMLQQQYEQYNSAVRSCYESIIWDMASEIESLHTYHQDMDQRMRDVEMNLSGLANTSLNPKAGEHISWRSIVGDLPLHIDVVVLASGLVTLILLIRFSLRKSPGQTHSTRQAPAVTSITTVSAEPLEKVQENEQIGNEVVMHREISSSELDLHSLPRNATNSSFSCADESDSSISPSVRSEMDTLSKISPSPTKQASFKSSLGGTSSPLKRFTLKKNRAKAGPREEAAALAAQVLIRGKPGKD